MQRQKLTHSDTWANPCNLAILQSWHERFELPSYVLRVSQNYWESITWAGNKLSLLNFLLHRNPCPLASPPTWREVFALNTTHWTPCFETFCISSATRAKIPSRITSSFARSRGLSLESALLPAILSWRKSIRMKPLGNLPYTDGIPISLTQEDTWIRRISMDSNQGRAKKRMMKKRKLRLSLLGPGRPRTTRTAEKVTAISLLSNGFSGKTLDCAMLHLFECQMNFLIWTSKICADKIWGHFHRGGIFSQQVRCSRQLSFRYGRIRISGK